MLTFVLAALLAATAVAQVSAPPATVAPVATPTFAVPAGIPTPPPVVPGANATIRRSTVPLPAGPHLALIVDSGSTNAAGYEILVRDDGWTTATTAGGTTRRRIDRALARRFVGEVRAAAPVDRLAAGQCMKSASFGSTLTIAFDGRRSPDLSCGDDPQTSALVRDAHAIATASAIGTVVGRPRHPLTR